MWKDDSENRWHDRLISVANLTKSEVQEKDPKIVTRVETLCGEVLSRLLEAGVKQRRDTSAELNGIYGINKNKIDELCKNDIRFLICVDTFLGQSTADVLCELLREIELPSASKVVPRNLRTSSDKDFSHGIRELVNWCGCLDSCRFQGYRVVFNLVGSFKALQGFMTAIGMFYADEMVYIFEGEGSHLFSIPKLPVKVDA